jgi:predicted acylesterase/phospholipase RssA
MEVLSSSIENPPSTDESQPLPTTPTAPTAPLPTNIKHIVISGGGVSIFTSYGVLKESHQSGFWKLENIQTIYGTSAGAILGFIILLGFDWKVLDDYFILRPWQNVFKIDVLTIMNSFQKRGILDIRAIEGIIDPLLLAKDMETTITLKELYEKTGIEFHVFTSEMENFCGLDVSYKTHPHWKISEAIYSSCCLPCLFSPFMKEGKTYIDGGMFSNYPTHPCYQSGAKKEEIFGLCNTVKDPFEKTLTNESTLFDFIMDLLFRMFYKISNQENTPDVLPHEIMLEISMVSIYDIYLATSDIKQREHLIEKGYTAWKQWYNV